mgnify:CR=1 FL=1
MQVILLEKIAARRWTDAELGAVACHGRHDRAALDTVRRVAHRLARRHHRVQDRERVAAQELEGPGEGSGVGAGLGDSVALITDGRFSGATHGLMAGHVARLLRPGMA